MAQGNFQMVHSSGLLTLLLALSRSRGTSSVSERRPLPRESSKSTTLALAPGGEQSGRRHLLFVGELVSRAFNDERRAASC